jgi:hypothetical protein
MFVCVHLKHIITALITYSSVINFIITSERCKLVFSFKHKIKCGNFNVSLSLSVASKLLGFKTFVVVFKVAKQFM